MNCGPVVVVSTETLTESQSRRIQEVSPQIILQFADRDRRSLQDQLKDAEVLLSHFRKTDFNPSLAPNLRWIQLVSASVEDVFDQPIAKTEVTLTNCSGIHAVPIGEYVLASLLAFIRHFPELLERQRRRHWSLPPEIYERLVGGELRGATLGIVGYGSIGREVARLGRSFGMRVVAVKRDPSRLADSGWRSPGTGDPDGSIPEKIFGPEALHEFLAECDHVVICCPLTPSTEGIIDQAALAAMKDTACLVNVGRGKLIREDALLEALQKKQIAGAILDVMTVEPLPAESPFFDLSNVILTPHCSGTTPYYDDRATEVFCQNLRRYLKKRPLLNVVNRSAGY